MIRIAGIRKMNKKEKRLRDQRGFTIAETMVSLLIMSFICLAIGSGVPALQRLYEQVILISDAQIALTTTVTLMSDELRFATDVESPAANGGSTPFVSGNNGYRSYFQNYTITDSNHSIKLICEKSPENRETIDLMSEAALAKRLGVRFTSYSYNDATGLWTIKGLEVVDRWNVSEDPANPGPKVLAREEQDISIRRINR